jgi:hypothetical protein
MPRAIVPISRASDVHIAAIPRPMAAKDRAKTPRPAERLAGAFRELALRAAGLAAGLLADRFADFLAGGPEREPEAREGRCEEREEPLAERVRDERGEADVRDAMWAG